MMACWHALQQAVDNSEPIDETGPKPSEDAVELLEKLNAYVASMATLEPEKPREMPCTDALFRGHLMSLLEQVGLLTSIIEMWFEELPIPSIAKELASFMFEQGKQDDLLKLYLTLYRQNRGEVQFKRT